MIGLDDMCHEEAELERQLDRIRDRGLTARQLKRRLDRAEMIRLLQQCKGYERSPEWCQNRPTLDLASDLIYQAMKFASWRPLPVSMLTPAG